MNQKTKKIVANLIAIIIVVSMIASCDYIHNVNPDVVPTTTTGTTTGPAVIYKKAFVEDYTGHKCGNCPKAAVELKTLETTYAGKIVPLAIHAGFFALVSASYPTDYQTPTGDAYDNTFGISTVGNPNGLVNRVGYGTGGFIKAYTVWGTEVASIVTTPAKFQIKIKNDFVTATSILNSTITVKSLTTNSGTYKLVVLLSEDKVVSEQLDYGISSGSQKVLDYEFNHVLRAAVNSTWGDAVFTTPAYANDSIVKTYTNFSVNPSYVPANCHVVAYIYDASASSPTYYEVFQAEEEKVK